MRKLLLFSLLFTFATAVSAQNKPLVLRDTTDLGNGLKILLIKAGTGNTAMAGQKVKVRYVGRFTNGAIFDSNEDGEPFKFVLGKQQVIPGWDKCLQYMRKGDRAILIIPPTEAYGHTGVKKPDSNEYTIPPDSKLLFVVDMLDFK